MTQQRRRWALGIHALGWAALSVGAAMARAGLGSWWLAPAVACFAVTLAYSLYELVLGLDVEGVGEDSGHDAAHRAARSGHPDRGGESEWRGSSWSISDLYGSSSLRPDDRRFGRERSRSVRGSGRTVAGLPA